jgi:hypothetical protein
MSKSLEFLTEALRRLPGVGPKSAQRMAFHLLQHDREGADMLSRALHQAVNAVHHCALCNTFTEEDVCDTCDDESRDRRLLCVVETPADQLMIEQTLTYKGLYFVLMGRLSPLDGIGPKDIHLETGGARRRRAGHRGGAGHQFHQRRRSHCALHLRDAEGARPAVSRRARRAGRRRTRIRRRGHHRPRHAGSKGDLMTRTLPARWPASRYWNWAR